MSDMGMTQESGEKIHEIVDLASRLIRFGAVSAGGGENPAGIKDSFEFIRSILEDAGINVIVFSGENEFPALYCDAGMPGDPPIGDFLLAGHYDVVTPENESQFEPVVDGDWLKGRGAADMLTVVATYIVFMRDIARKVASGELGAPKMGLLLVGNEETGETDPWGTPHVLRALKARFGFEPGTLVAGERTGEGTVTMGKVEVRNKGLIRYHLEARGESAHTAVQTKMTPMEKIFVLKEALSRIIASGPGEDEAWRTTFNVSYFMAGQQNNFNITVAKAVAGFEIRPIPETPVENLISAIEKRCAEMNISCKLLNCEPGVRSDPDDTRVARILSAVSYAGGGTPASFLGSGKPHGTQLRFAPEGTAAVVWGQAGVGPHAANEAHYIPSIKPYYHALRRIARE